MKLWFYNRKEYLFSYKNSHQQTFFTENATLRGDSNRKNSYIIWTTFRSKTSAPLSFVHRKIFNLYISWVRFSVVLWELASGKVFSRFGREIKNNNCSIKWFPISKFSLKNYSTSSSNFEENQTQYFEFSAVWWVNDLLFLSKQVKTSLKK